MKKLFSIVPFFIFVFCNTGGNAQCTIQIPADVFTISSDTMVNCSIGSLLNKSIFICPGAHLLLTGNSTCLNRFFIDSGAVLKLNDTIGNAPYGQFKFFVKATGTLHFNDSNGIAFPIDTLFYETGAIFTDTGNTFIHILACNPMPFDYSLLTGSIGCPTAPAPTGLANAEKKSIRGFPNPAFISGTFSLMIPEGKSAGLIFNDLTGRRTGTYMMEPGKEFSVKFDPENFQAGIYFYSLIVDDILIKQDKIVILR